MEAQRLTDPGRVHSVNSQGIKGVRSLLPVAHGWITLFISSRV
jgi:hypothetical protein